MKTTTTYSTPNKSITGFLNNIKINSGLLSLLFVLFFAEEGFSQTTYYSRATGDWSSTSTWSTVSHAGAAASGTPVAGDIVYIGANTVTVTANAACASITFDVSGGTLSVNPSTTLTLTSDITVNHISQTAVTAVISGSGTITGVTALNIGSNITSSPTALGSATLTTSVSVLNVGAINLYADVAGASSYEYTPNLNLSSGTITCSGQITTSTTYGGNSTSDFNITNNTGTGNSTLILTSSTANPFTISGTGTSNITLNGTNATVEYGYSGAQTVRQTNYSNLTFSGSSSTKTASALTLANNLTINLSTGNPTVNYAASNGTSWTADKYLTITGWTGTAGATGTGGKIFFGTANTGLTASQLLQVVFLISGVEYPATILSTGEIVPSSTSARTFYSKANGAWTTLASWAVGSHAGNVAFDYPRAGDIVYIQHAMTFSADAACATIYFDQASGTTLVPLTINSPYTLQVSGSIILLSNNATNNLTNTIAGTGTVNCSNIDCGNDRTSAFTMNALVKLVSTVTNLNVSSTLTVRANFSSSYRLNAEFNLSSGTMNLGNMVITTEALNTLDAKFSNTGSGTLKFTGTGTVVTKSGGQGATSATETVDFTGSSVEYIGSASQTIFATSYKGLKIANTGGTATLGGNINVGGDWDNDGTFSASTYDVTFNGAVNQSILGDNSTTFNKIYVNNPGYTATLTRNITCSELNFNNTTSAATATFSVNTGITLTINGSLTKTSVLSTTYAVLTGLGTVNCTSINIGTAGTSGAGVDAQNYFTSTISTLTCTGDLTILGYCSGSYDIRTYCYFNSGTIQVANVLLTITAGGSCTTNVQLRNDQGAASSLLKISGANSITTSGSGNIAIALNGASSTVEYNGSSAQNVYTTTYNNLKINNSHASGCSLTGAVSTASLDITQGILTTTSTNTLTVTGTATSAITRTSGYVSGPLLWTIASAASSSGGSYVFPVGKGGNYYPLTISSYTAGSNSTVTVEAFNSSPAGTYSSGTLSTTEYWNVKPSVALSTGKVTVATPSFSASSGQVGQATPNANGTYTNLGGLVSSNTITSTTNINLSAATNYYYAIISGYPTTFYSNSRTANTAAQTLANWNSQTNGSGVAPISFTSSGQTFIVQSGDKYQVAGTWTGESTSLIQVNSGGALDLNGANAATITSWQKINVAGTGVSSSGALLNSSATASSFSIPITLTADATINASGTGGLTLSGIISGSANLTETAGAGTTVLTLSGVNTYTGSTTVTSGTMKLGASGVIPDASLVTVASGATLDMNSYNETVGHIAGAGTIDNTTSSSFPTLTFGNSTDQTFSGIIKNTSGTLYLIKNGTGAITLSGANTFSGGLTFNTGTLNIGHATALGSSTLTINGGTLDATGADRSITNPIDIASNFTFAGSYNLTQTTGAIGLLLTPTITVSNKILSFGGVIDEKSVVTISKAGNGVWTCPTGVSSISIHCWGGGGGGSAAATNGGTSGGGGGTYSNVVLSVSPSNSYNYFVGAGGQGGVGTSGSCSVTSGTNGGDTYFGNTSQGSDSGSSVKATGGTFGSGGTVGTSSTALNIGSTFYAGGSGSASGTGPAGGGGGQGGCSGSIGASGSNLNGGNAGSGTYLGGAGGAGGADANGSSGVLPGGGGGGSDGGGTNSSACSGATAKNGGAGGAGQIIITYSGLLCGLTKSGTGTLTLAGANLYAGVTTVNAGTLTMGVNNAIPVGGAGVILNGGALSTGNYTAGSTSTNIGTLTLSDNSTLALGTGTLYFSSSTAVSWTAAKTLTITGFVSSATSTAGTAGRLFVSYSSGNTCSNCGLTGSSGTNQLALISFNTATINGVAAVYGATQLSSGEIVAFDSVCTTNTWNGNTSTAWATTTNWSCGIVPTSAHDVVIPDVTNDPIISSDASVKSISVDAGGALTVNSGNTLTVTNLVTVASGGSLVFENTAGLLQTNTGANSGNIVYKRTTTTLSNNYDFVYWGSPVASQTLGTIWMASGWGDTFYSFNTSGNYWSRAYAATTMTPGVGYIARSRNGQPGTDYNNVSTTFNTGGTWTAKFYGVPNNGTVTVPVVKTADTPYNLIGNPYPSAVDLNAFYTTNQSLITANFYFWTHATAMTNNSYSDSDYGLYNITLGSVGGIATYRYVAAGQGFFTEASTLGTASASFTNAHRVSSSSSQNSYFYRPAKQPLSKNSFIEIHRIWFNLVNSQSAIKQQLLAYVEGATTGFDTNLDAVTLEGNPNFNFYSIITDKKLMMQSRPLPFDENDIVSLGYKTTTAGTFQIVIDRMDGMFVNLNNVYLEDKLLNVIHNLKQGSYSFTSASGTFNDRFVIRYKDTSLGTTPVDFESSVKAVVNDKVTIYAGVEPIQSIEVIDLLGRTIRQYDKINATTYTLGNLFKNDKVLFLKIKLSNQVVVTKKIVF